MLFLLSRLSFLAGQCELCCIKRGLAQSSSAPHSCLVGEILMPTSRAWPMYRNTLLGFAIPDTRRRGRCFCRIKPITCPPGNTLEGTGLYCRLRVSFNVLVAVFITAHSRAANVWRNSEQIVAAGFLRVAALPIRHRGFTKMFYGTTS